MTFQTPSRDILPRHPVIVGDQLIERGGGQRWAHVYPATGAVTTELALAGPQDVDAAVNAARAAFLAWRNMAGDKRRDLMLKMAALLEQNIQPLSEMMIIENGSVSMTAPYIVLDAVQKFRYFAGWADKIGGETIRTWGGPAHDYVEY